MNARGFKYLLALMALLLAVGLACGTPAPTAEPTEPPPPPPTAEVAVVDEPAGSELVTFTDESNYFEIDVPGDWEYGQEEDAESNNWYWDKFVSPDGFAGIESIVYDEGKSINTGKTALNWLHQFYSSTGQEGDIRISDDSIQKDGSERLTWESKGGDYSGMSFFEVRKPTAMLMFTVWWDNAYQDEYGELLDEVIASYRIP
jgi:hypothetical protein